MTTLANYITYTRRLLHDANANFWTDSELTDYINAGRNRVTADTGCSRSLQSYSLISGQESYVFSSVLPLGSTTIDVLNITLLWGNMRVPMNYMPFTEFNSRMRVWQSYTGRPVVFTVYGQSTVYVGPIPDQVYVTEWDTVVSPTTLVNSGDVETILFPYTEPVTYYAAYMAKYKEQSYQEAQMFHDEYKQKVLTAIRSGMTRRLPTAYGG
jgi:hypothetical protein